MPFVLVTPELYEAFLPCVPEEYVPLLGDPQAMVIGMVDADTSVATGIIMGTVWGSTLYVDWLYVVEPSRHHGIGTMLIQHLLYLSRECVQAVRAQFDPANAGLSSLFSTCLFDIEYEEGNSYRVTLGELRNHSILKSFRSGVGVVPLSQVPQFILNKFSQEMEDTSATVETPIEPSSYNEQLSYLCIHDQQIVSCLLIQDADDGLHIAFVYTQRAYVRSLVSLICIASQKALETYLDSTPVTVSTVVPEATAIINKMFGDARPLKVCVASFQF